MPFAADDGGDPLGERAVVDRVGEIVGAPGRGQIGLELQQVSRRS